MKAQKVKIGNVKPNPENPRIIKDYKFEKLVKSIKDFPQMLELRPIVVNENNVILGGNMRYKASVEAGLKEIHIIKAEDLTPEQQREFIVKDNVGFGEWNWDVIANNWDNEQLSEWGLDIWQPTTTGDLEDFFQEEEEEEKPNGFKKLVLEFTEEEYEQVQDKIKEDGRAAETIFRTALDL